MHICDCDCCTRIYALRAVRFINGHTVKQSVNQSYGFTFSATRPYRHPDTTTTCR